jgi:hypothetical protein
VRPGTHRANSRNLVAGGASAIACAGLVALLTGVAQNEALWRPIGVCSGIAALALILALVRMGFGWLSAPVVYLAYLWLFHFPLALLSSLSDDTLQGLPVFIQAWMFDPSWYRAELIALTCAAAFTVGASLSPNSRVRRERPRRWSPDVPLATIGWIEVLCGALMIAFSIVKGGGAQVFQTPYAELFDSVFAGPFTYGVLLFTFGIPITLASVRRGSMWALVGLQGVWACVMLLLGARTAALFGPLLVAMVLTKRGVKIPRWIAIVSVTAVFWVIAAVGVARQGPVSDNITSAKGAGPLDALLEMGGSLYTVRLFDTWILDGDRFQLGGGYWLPVERAIGIVIPGIRSDLHTDPRAASEVLSSRTHGLGGSAVAEAYYNFGFFAPFVFFLPLGWLLGRLDRSASPLAVAWLVVLLYPLLMEVRGWFLSVPAIVALGATPLLLRSFSAWRHRLRSADARVRCASMTSVHTLAVPLAPRGTEC